MRGCRGSEGCEGAGVRVEVCRGVGVEGVAVSGGSAGKPAADAYDAGLDGALGVHLSVSPQLMLMMLARMGWHIRPRADAHDAGLDGAVVPESFQLMLMMLAWMGWFCRKAPSYCS